MWTIRTAWSWSARGEPVIVLRTFSKVYGLAGLRVGYGVAAPEVIEAVDLVREPFNSNTPGQAGALAALGDRDHVRRTLELTRGERDGAGRGPWPRGTCACCPAWPTSSAWTSAVPRPRSSARLLRRGVIVRPLEAYGLPTVAARLDRRGRRKRAAARRARRGPGGDGLKTAPRGRDGLVIAIDGPSGRRQVHRGPRPGRPPGLHVPGHRGHVPRPRPEGPARARAPRRRGRAGRPGAPQRIELAEGGAACAWTAGRHGGDPHPRRQRRRLARVGASAGPPADGRAAAGDGPRGAGSSSTAATSVPRSSPTPT